jgi:hypothetical protein
MPDSTGRSDHHDQQQSQTVHHDVPLAPTHLLPAVPSGRGARDGRRGPQRLRVDDCGGRLRIPAGVLTDQAAQPVVQLGEQARHPLGPVVSQIAHGVEHLSVAVALGLPAAALQPERVRHRVARD